MWHEWIWSCERHCIVVFPGVISSASDIIQPIKLVFVKSNKNDISEYNQFICGEKLNFYFEIQ